MSTKMDESIDVESLNKFTSGKQKLHQKKKNNKNVYAYYKTLFLFSFSFLKLIN